MQPPGHLKVGLTLISVIALIAPFALPAGATVPGSNGIIVFSSDRTGQQELYTARPDGSALRQLTHSAPGANSDHPAWSPDGEWIAFNRDNGTGVDLWLIDRAGHREHQLTHLPGVAAEPAWASDGQRIVFQYFNRSTTQDLYTIRPDGTHLVRITATPNADEVLASFSPDGSWLVYGYVTHSGTDTLSHVRVSRSDGSDPHDITPDALNGGRPSWSPDGRNIIFSSNNNLGVAQSLYTITPNGTNLHQVTTAPVGSSGDTFASYAPNGRSIIFTSDRNGAASDIYVARIDGTGLHDITPGTPNSQELDAGWRTR